MVNFAIKIYLFVALLKFSRQKTSLNEKHLKVHKKSWIEKENKLFLNLVQNKRILKIVNGNVGHGSFCESKLQGQFCHSMKNEFEKYEDIKIQ